MILRKSTQGSTLAELAVTSFVLTLLMGIVFMIFQAGYNGFQTVTDRQNAHTQLSAVRAALQQDLQMTDFYGLAALESTPIAVEGKEVARSALSAPALADWSDEKAFANLSDFGGGSAYLGAPRWNRWVVFRVTHNPQGELMRHVLSSDGQEGAQLLRAPDQLPAMVSDANQTRTGWPLLGTQRLASNVADFDVALDPEARGVSICLTIQSQKPKGEPEAVRANFFIKPHNTGAVD